MFAPRIEYKSPEQIRLMRRAGLVVADVHDAVRAAIAPGVSTAELDAVAAGALERAGATSNFLGYHGFPGVVCVSVNAEIVHGIPGDRVIQEGDVVSIDAGAVVEGWHGDAAFTVVVGSGDEADRALVATTEAAMWAGIAAVATGTRLGDVGGAVEDASAGYGIVREYTGHGIGTAMHQAPDVYNYRTNRRGPALRPGLCVAVEPMLTRGTGATRVLADDWTVVSTDDARAAHWEHTVARHSGGIWVLTARDGGTAGLAAHGLEPVPLD